MILSNKELTTLGYCSQDPATFVREARGVMSGAVKRLRDHPYNVVRELAHSVEIYGHEAKKTPYRIQIVEPPRATALYLRSEGYIPMIEHFKDNPAENTEGVNKLIQGFKIVSNSVLHGEGAFLRGAALHTANEMKMQTQGMDPFTARQHILSNGQLTEIANGRRASRYAADKTGIELVRGELNDIRDFAQGKSPYYRFEMYEGEEDSREIFPPTVRESGFTEASIVGAELAYDVYIIGIPLAEGKFEYVGRREDLPESHFMI